MAVYLDDLKDMKLYKKQVYLPIVREDKKKHSAILLLTRYQYDSIALMKHKLFLDPSKNFQSYYIEKDITYTINHENKLQIDHNDYSTIINEQASVFTEVTDVTNYDNKADCSINESYCQLGDKVIFFNDLYDEAICEAKGVNNKYRKLLYYDRIRNNREMMNLYGAVKGVGNIKYTFLDYKRYKEKNLFIDLSYYNNTYLTNNNFVIKKSIDMYFEFIRRFINDERITKAGYTKRTVFVPVSTASWGVQPETELYDYLKNLNPISVFYKKLKLAPNDLTGAFKDIDFVFIGDNGYFKMDMEKVAKDWSVYKTRFIKLIKSLLDNEQIDDGDEPDNSADAIASDIIDKIETNKGIKIHNLTGDKSENSEVKEKIKADLVEKINDASKDSVDEDEALDKLDKSPEVKDMIEDLAEEADDGIKLSASRVARINKAQNDLMNKKIHNMTIRDLINTSNKVEELPETALPIKTINEEWKHLKAINFEKEYDLDADIVAMLNSLSDTNKSYPISILNIDIQDTSTTEDSVYTYTVKCEDYSGKRFTLKFDIPKFRDGRFLKLRGNEKIYSIEMPLIPISKTDENTVQIATSYKKIFISAYYTSSGKSTFQAGALMKALDKYDSKDLKITLGDNSKICKKYDLPIDYIDLANKYNKIECNGKIKATLYFNQDEIRQVAKVDETKGIPIGIRDNKEVIYYDGEFGTVAGYIGDLLVAYLGDDFANTINSVNMGKKCSYSRCTIMAANIPTIVILAHGIGLTKAMELANVDYEITDKRKYKKNNGQYDTIKFADGFLSYRVTYSSMMLMNGLKDCNTEDYSIKKINTKNMWVEMLDNFGGRIKSDGLDNFKDLEFDPISKRVCQDYGLPDNYFEALIYANNMLSDNKYVKQTDLSSNRYRTNEVVAVHFYQELGRAYGEYATMNRRGANPAMFIKQSAIIDSILAANTTSDLSIFQPLSEIEAKNSISFKGAVGMNTERAFSIDKRGYDKSMVNIIAQATGFASTVGVNRQTSINPNITGGRGYFKTSGEDNMSITNTMSITEALSPFTLTSDDPFRNAMTFVQTSKHTTPIEKGSPLLVTTGADAAMPYLTSDMFCHKAKGKGKVKEIVPDRYLLVEYSDGSTEYVTLEERTMKNSDGGFYIPLQLVTDLKVGDTVKENTILAYDKKSFSKKVGDNKQLAYNLGCIAKIAIMTTEDGYEDSAIASEWLSEAMATNIVVMKDIELPPKTEILKMPKKGDSIVEGEPMLIFQNAYDEEDANALLKALNNDEEAVSEIGRNTINAKVTGVIQDIKIYRTVELDELSDSLRKIVTDKEREIKKYSSIASKSSNDTNSLFDPADKLDRNGKLKNVDGVRIEIYMKYHDKLSVGDKVVANSANKMVLMNIYSDKDAPYTDFRPTEKIDIIGSASAIDGRMITSNFKLGALYKLMIETHRYCCEKLGIKWKTLHEIYNDDK